MNKFLRLLREKSILLLDGAMGTNLFSKGLGSGDAPELWNLTKTAIIREHEEADMKIRNIALGKADQLDIRHTFTYGETNYRVMKKKLEDISHLIMKLMHYLHQKYSSLHLKFLRVQGQGFFLSQQVCLSDKAHQWL